MNLRVKKFVLIILVNALLLGVGVLALETIFGNWLKPAGLDKLHIGRSLNIKFNIEGLYEYPQRNVTFTTDAYGLRGSFDQPSEIDILTVGGSTTVQVYINDGETWQDVMENQLKLLGKNFVIANAGVNGQSTYGHIKNFDWWFPYVPGLKPQYILFYVGINDFHKEEGYARDALVIEGTHTIPQILREKSATYHLLRALRGIYQARFAQGLHHTKINYSEVEWINYPLLDKYDDLMETRLSEYAERLDLLINRTTQFGSIPIFVTQPSRKYRVENAMIQGIKKTDSYDGLEINGVDYYYMMRKLVEVTMSTCREQQALCIDLSKETAWVDNDFYDYFHMTPEGAKKVGTYLAERLYQLIE